MRLIIFILLLSVSLHSQTRAIDSLLNVLKNAKEDTLKVKTLDRLCRKMQDNYSLEAMKYAKEQMDLSKKLKYAKGERAALMMLGNLHFDKGNYDISINYYMKRLKLAEEIGDSLVISRCYINIANVLKANREYDKALDYENNALKICIKLNEKKNIAALYTNIGIIYYQKKDYPIALEYYLKSLEIRKLLDDKTLLSESYDNLGLLYLAMKNTNESLNSFLLAINFGRDAKNQRMMANACVNIGELYYQLKDYKKSIAYIDSGITFLENAGMSDWLRHAYLTKAYAYNRLNDSYNCDLYLTKYVKLNDSLFTIENSHQISELQIKYETEKKERENLILITQVQAKQLQLNKTLYLTAGLIGLMLLLIVIGFLIIRQYKLKSQQKSMQLEQKLLRTQMNPHFIFNSLTSIEGFMYSNKPDEAGSYLSDFSRLMRLILENSRQEYITLQKEIDTITYYLRLQKLTLQNSFTYAVTVDERLNPEEIEVPPMLIQPFIENSIKYGITKERKGHIDVRYYKGESNSLIIEITDNGPGINKSEANTKHNSLATTITHERLSLMNKHKKSNISFTISDLSGINKNENGTRVVFILPLS